MQKIARIAFFTGEFPVISETFILRQITALLERGHDVRIFANKRNDSPIVHDEVVTWKLLDRTIFINGPVESVYWELPLFPVWGKTWTPGAGKPVANASRLVHALPVIAASMARAPTTAIRVMRKYSFQGRSLSGVYRLRTLLRCHEQFDVLHAHFGPVGNSFRFARELWHAPLVVSFHGYDFTTLPRRQGAHMYRDLFAVADAITANSEYTRGCLEKLGCPREKLELLPVGLDLKQFPFRERILQPGEPVRILTVARLVEIKGHEYVLHALAMLRDRAFGYDIVGDGPLRKKLEALAHDLGLRDRVFFHGESGTLQPFYARAHLFILASVTIEGDQEGQGLALQEAQACGLPVIATRHGAFPEGIPAESHHWLVPERSPEGLAEAIQHLIRRHQEWSAIGQRGRQFVAERYDMPHLTTRLLDIYDRARSRFALSV